MSQRHIRILLIDDDKDYPILIEALLGDIPDCQFDVEWASTYEQGLASLCSGRHDVCLVDYFLGDKNGFELLKTAKAAGCQVPILLLTGHLFHESESRAIYEAGSDYLRKNHLDAQTLKYAILYFVEKK